MEVSIRSFERHDIEFALEQTHREGWHATADSFDTWITHDPDGCFIAESAGRRVGMVTTTRFLRTAWIGNVIVPPDFRKQGIGRRIMTHVMDYLANRSIPTIRLEADPPGVNLYRSFGFVDEFESLRFETNAPRTAGKAAATQRDSPDTPSRGLEPARTPPHPLPHEPRMLLETLKPDDLPTLLAFDADHFGDDRSRLLHLLLDGAQLAYCLRDEGRLRGYAFVLPSRIGLHVGPGVATDRQAADVLLRTILSNAGDTLVHLGIPAPNRQRIALLESLGFTRDAPCLRMIHGPYTAGGCPENIFAIAGGAMG